MLLVLTASQPKSPASYIVFFIIYYYLNVYPLDCISLEFQHVDGECRDISIRGLSRPNMSIMFGLQRIQYLFRKRSWLRHVACDPHKTCKKSYSKNITASSKSASSFPMRTWIGPFGLGSIQSERKIKSRQSQTLRLFHWKDNAACHIEWAALLLSCLCLAAGFVSRL